MADEKTIMIHIKQSDTDIQRDIPLEKGMSLYHILQKEGIRVSAPCGGNGTCGACKVQLLQGDLPITKKDKTVLKKEQLEAGWRLACQAYPSDSCMILVPIESFHAITGYYDNRESAMMTTREDSLKESYAIAIDLGTTTLAYELFSLKTGETYNSFSSTNPQRSYGADVVTRIDQSNNGRKELLKNILRQGIRKDIVNLIKGVNPACIRKIGISGNTAMVHFLMGYHCEGLGKYPFTAVTLDSIEEDACHMGLMDLPIPVMISPGISAYVGGDVLMGVMAQDAMVSQKSYLFLDLGTNAEMLLSDSKGKIYVTSAPAGPAFEAGNISCGVGSIKGAISSVSIQNNRVTTTTIQDGEPLGFCGSGILEAIYELLKNDMIDETGLFSDAYFTNGYPIEKLKITQNDIRQIQLAKSAVMSAIKILLKKAGMTIEEIENAYLAGGFGYHLNIEKVIGIGLLPKELAGRIRAIGNASLKGTKEYLAGNRSVAAVYALKNSCEEIYLSNEVDFQTIFMENINFQLI